jgi:hypothetical protein
MFNGLPTLYENVDVVRSDSFRTGREMTLLLLAQTGVEFADLFPAWNKVCSTCDC